MIVFLRFLGQLFFFMIVLISLSRLLTHHDANFDEINNFFLDTMNCDTAPCFMGIIPNETEQLDVYATLEQNPLVADFRMAQVEFGLGQLFIEWNGGQPNFINNDNNDSYVTLIGERAATIEITPDLLLGEMMIALGEPTQVLLSTFNVYLYYLDEGILIESEINCRSIWHSPVQVIYRRQSLQLSNLSERNVRIIDYCR